MECSTLQGGVIGAMVIDEEEQDESGFPRVIRREVLTFPARASGNTASDAGCIKTFVSIWHFLTCFTFLIVNNVH